MAKKAAKPAEPEQPPPETTPSSNGENISGYFRKVFKENPKLLKERSNDALSQRWLADHPGESTVPENVKSGLANIKSILRKKAGKRGRKTHEERPAQEAFSPPKKLDTRRLEELEHQIDEVLHLAKGIDREGLSHVIAHLRAARNTLVLRVGWE